MLFFSTSRRCLLKRSASLIPVALLHNVHTMQENLHGRKLGVLIAIVTDQFLVYREVEWTDYSLLLDLCEGKCEWSLRAMVGIGV